MTTTTTQDLLRRAAARLRETAAAASTETGPWSVQDGNLWLGGTTWGYRVPIEGNLRDTDADWIALASPVLAEPLAAWLEQYADWEETSFYSDLSGRFHTGCDVAEDECDCFDRATAVARAVLGES